jgi:fucose 4-O-acetylase-like acetyltransferase
MLVQSRWTVHTNKHRSIVADMAKGIAIVLVVYSHCLRGLVSANLVPSGSWLATVDYMIYTFHMPIFFVLSGLFFAASAQKNRRAFWLNRFKTIVYPYFLSRCRDWARPIMI